MYQSIRLRYFDAMSFIEKVPLVAERWAHYLAPSPIAVEISMTSDHSTSLASWPRDEEK